jgi:hypothetical protein
VVTTLAVLFLIGGGLAFAFGMTRHASPPPPRPPAIAAGSATSPATIPAPRPTRPPARPNLPASPPVALSIPAIGVQSAIVSLGRNADGSVEVPASFHVAGWYREGVAPGQNGPAVFLGQVDSMSGPGIFYNLGALRPGARVVATRADGKQIAYVITGVRQYDKTAFPTLDVYGNTPKPTIRLVTCGGAFDQRTHHYLSNIVAFGEAAESG